MKTKEVLKFTIIKSKEQYDKYSDMLENMVSHEDKSTQDEIELLTWLIEKWDNEHNSLKELNPVELLKVLMNEQNLKPVDLIGILDLSKGTISKVLNYHKGISKEAIRKLAVYFKVSQEAFNRPYRLMNEANDQIYPAVSGIPDNHSWLICQ